MATVKIGTLLIRTLAKPISARIKDQAREHERFRKVCVSLAQTMYRYEVRLRTGLLGEPVKHIRPLSEARAIENGANFLAEGFLFSVAVALIVGETWRSSRSQSKQRSDVNGSIEELRTRVHELGERLRTREEAAAEERRQYVTAHLHDLNLAAKQMRTARFYLESCRRDRVARWWLGRRTRP